MTYISIDEAEGKTVDIVEDGYETVRIEFEDGSVATVHKGVGNHRDI